MSADVSSFVIQETTGDRRRVELRGRGLPYRPFTLTGEQRHDITWYSGSPDGTLQLLGAKEDPTTIRGWWKDRFIKQVGVQDALEVSGLSEINRAGSQGSPPVIIDGQQPTNVRSLAEIIDDIRVKGQIVQVEWLNQVRKGILNRFVQNWHTSNDLEYEIGFVWNVRGDVDASNAPLRARRDDISDAIDEFFDEILNLGAVGAVGLAGTAAARVLETVDDLIDDLDEGVTNLEDAFLGGAQAITAPVATAQRAAGVLSFLKVRAAELKEVLDRQVNALTLNGTEDLGERLARQKDTRNRKKAASNITGVAGTNQDRVTKQLNPELVRSFIARENQDLRDVSVIHYGTPDEWRNLMKFNGLSTSRLGINQVVFVPRTPPRGERC